MFSRLQAVEREAKLSLDYCKKVTLHQPENWPLAHTVNGVVLTSTSSLQRFVEYSILEWHDQDTSSKFDFHYIQYLHVEAVTILRPSCRARVLTLQSATIVVCKFLQAQFTLVISLQHRAF